MKTITPKVISGETNFSSNDKIEIILQRKGWVFNLLRYYLGVKVRPIRIVIEGVNNYPKTCTVHSKIYKYTKVDFGRIILTDITKTNTIFEGGINIHSYNLSESEISDEGSPIGLK